MNLIKTIESSIITRTPEYNTMLANISDNLPAIDSASANFFKTHTQFMGVSLDITDLTARRSIMRTLAEVTNTRAALQDAYFNIKKKQIEINRKEAALSTTTDVYDRELLDIEIAELESQIATTQPYILGAVRKLNFFINQYNNLLKNLNISEITEEEYEREECKYHIMTAMKQALLAARSHGGIIDEGNLIYLFELGINGAHAQLEVSRYIEMENNMIAAGRVPTHELTIKWLEACAEMWKANPIEYIQARGFEPVDAQSLCNISEQEVNE